MPYGLMQLVGYGAQDIYNTPVAILKPIYWPIINKLIDLTKNNECPISYNKFDDNCLYCICDTCNYNIDYENLKQWFDGKTIKTCPMCRNTWTKFIIYKNI